MQRVAAGTGAAIGVSSWNLLSPAWEGRHLSQHAAPRRVRPEGRHDDQLSDAAGFGMVAFVGRGHRDGRLWALVLWVLPSVPSISPAQPSVRVAASPTVVRRPKAAACARLFGPACRRPAEAASIGSGSSRSPWPHPSCARSGRVLCHCAALAGPRRYFHSRWRPDHEAGGVRGRCRAAARLRSSQRIRCCR